MTMTPNPGGTGNLGRFGTCCQDLKDVLTAEDFDPLVYVGEDDVLYMSIGILEMEGEGDDEDPGFLDHPIYCCPFCGTKLQTADEVEAKASDV
jgi:hypothetical protein